MHEPVEDPTGALRAALALLGHAMHDSQPPVLALGAALERMADVLKEQQRSLERAARSLGAEELRELRDTRSALERELTVCIESLQFHDRLMQQLAHVRDCLCGSGMPQPPAGLHRASLSEGSVELF